MRYNQIINEDGANGPGMRVTLFLQGCDKRCKGCHNPESWDLEGGKEYTPEIKAKVLKYLSSKYIRGLSISGGEPLLDCNQDELGQLLIEVTTMSEAKDIWLWTGYEFHEIADNPVIQYCDYIVTGPYIERLKSSAIRFKGSANQRIWENLHRSGGWKEIGEWTSGALITED